MRKISKKENIDNKVCKMAIFKSKWQTMDKLLWGLGVVLGMLVPVLTDQLSFLTRVHWVVWFLLVVNGIYSIWGGNRVAKRQLSVLNLLVFPVLFLLAAYFFMPHFTYYFAPAYWAVSYLAWASRQQ